MGPFQARMRDPVLVPLARAPPGISGKHEVTVPGNWLLFVTGRHPPSDLQGKRGRPQEGADLGTSMSSLFSPPRHPKGAGFHYSIFSDE